MKLRNTLIAVASAVALSALAGGASAATLTASAVSSVTVVSPVTLTKTQDMAFGTVVRPSASSTSNTTFTMSAAGAVSATGGDGTVVSSPTTAAKFSLVNTTPGVTFTPSAVLSFAPAGLINVSAGAPLITGATGTSAPFGLTVGGTATLAYGGQFDVTPATAAQTYTGTLALTINYN
jgi:hypothetical protein